MKSWRLNWTLKEIFNVSNFSKHRETLKSPAKFWMAVFLKLIPDFFRKPIRLKLRKGGEFEVSEFMTLYIYKEIFVDGCYDLPSLSMKEPSIIDIGANTGLFAIRMKQKYPLCTIYCYEPVPQNYRQLQNNLEISGFTNCETFMEGIGDRPRDEKLYIHNRNIGGHSIYSNVADSSKSINISLIDIKSALNRLKGESCHLLKLDCEGAEYEIIKSMDNTVASKIERLVFEPTPAVYNIEELKNHLNQIGYRVEWNSGIYIALRKDLT